MEKRNKRSIPSIIKESTGLEFPEATYDWDKGVDIEHVALYTTVEQSTKRLQSVYPAHLKITGRASGKLYQWYKAGDVVDVDLQDVDELLAKRIGNSSCCGSAQKGNLLLKVI